MSDPNTPKFTLRFHKPGNHELLGLLAERYGVSKNQLAEDMLERELQAAALLPERQDQ
jgi:predicted HicB family RNase H-like nuclease